MLPMAAALTEANAPHESWYSIKAAGRGVAEVLLYDEIGVWASPRCSSPETSRQWAT